MTRAFDLLNMQIEWLTAGDCIAGMHEVVVNSRTTDAIKVAIKQNCSLWRVSSTVILVAIFFFFLSLLSNISF